MYAVDVKEKSGFRKKIEECKIIPVVVDLINEDDIGKISSKRKRQTEVAVRLYKQAYEQGAVMLHFDTVAICGIGSYVREYEKETGKTVFKV